MEGRITINLPEGIASALEEATRDERLLPDEVIQKAIADHLFIRKFHSLRERLMAKAPQSYTDQDIFDIVS